MAPVKPHCNPFGDRCADCIEADRKADQAENHPATVSPAAPSPRVPDEVFNPENVPDTITETKPRKVATRTPKREADYRKALHSHGGLSYMALLAGLVIGHRYWSSGELYASQGLMAEQMGLSRSSRKSVRDAVAELEAVGFLVKIGTKPNGTLWYRMSIPIDG